MIGTAVAMALFGPEALVHAQTASGQAGSDQNLQEVVVTGIRASLEQSLEQKRAAASVEEVITSEDVGKMPDKNIADSLKRIPGVTISSMGASEGAFDENDRVSMRGTGPSLTQTLINGHNVASGDWFVLDQVTTVGRSVSYTLLPSELVSKVVVHKSSEADLVEGGVAGSVDIITRKPLDFSNPFTFQGSVGEVYADLPSKTDPQLSALVNWKNADSNFGVLVQGFYEKRHLRRDGVELLGYDTIAPGSAIATAHPDLSGVVYPTDIGAAFFEQERKRTGGLIDAQFKPSDAVNFDLTEFYSQLEAPNFNRNYLLWNTHYINFGAGQAPDPGYVVQNGTLVQANFTGVSGTNYGVYDQISRPDESAQSNFINLDGTFRLSDRLNLFGQVGNSEGHGKTPTQDVSETSPGTGNGAGWQLNGIGSGPSFNLGATNNAVPFPSGNPSALTFGWIFGAQAVDVDDKESWGKLDANFATPDSGAWTDLKFGARYAKHSRQAINNIAQGPTFCATPNGSGAGTCPSSYPTTFLNYPSNFNTFGGNIPTGIWYWTPGQLAVYNQPSNVQRGALPRAYPNDWFGLDEKDSAAYVQADFKGTGWAGNIGLRYVNTKEDVTVYSYVSAQTPGAVTTSLFPPPGDGFIGLPVNHTYNDLLPSANLKLDLAKDLVGRFAVAETMTRADYSALAGFTNLTPPGAVNPNGQASCTPPPVNCGSGTGSNPALKPIRSTNYDAGLEWYFAPRSLLAGSLFYMDLRNYVGYGTQFLSYQTYGAATAGYPANGVPILYNLTVPINTQGRAQGIELTYTQAITDHFGAEANYSFNDAKQTSAVPPGGDDRLVGASKNVYNLTGYFENAHFSTRVSWNYRSAYYAGLDRSTAFSQDALGTLAASISYLYNENLSLTLDGQNLNDPTYKYYALNTTQPRAFYLNGRQFYLSLRAKF